VGHASVAFDGVGPKQEDLRDDRGLAQSSIEGEHPLCLSRRIVLKRSWAGEVRNVSLLVAIGVNESGYREILGICEGQGRQDWLERVPQASQGTRLKGVRLITLCLHWA